jgi:hypothetical protein
MKGAEFSKEIVLEKTRGMNIAEEDSCGEAVGNGDWRLMG